MKQLHPIQLQILKKLVFVPSLRYSETKPDPKMDNNQFDFHLDSLITAGYIVKDENGYMLTASGKEYANRMDTEEVIIEKQAKIGIAINCIKEEDGIKQFLIQQRLKQPYYGYHGSVTGKVRIGETALETAQRELKEETGLTADLKLVRIKHKMDYNNDGKLLEDKFFFVFRGDNPRGELIEQFDGGKNLWLSLDEIEKLDKVFPDLLEGIKLLESPTILFHEHKYTVNEF